MEFDYNLLHNAILDLDSDDSNELFILVSKYLQCVEKDLTVIEYEESEETELAHKELDKAVQLLEGDSIEDEEEDEDSEEEEMIKGKEDEEEEDEKDEEEEFAWEDED